MSSDNPTPLPLSRPLDTNRVAGVGFRERIVANDSERAAVAKSFGLEAVHGLEGKLDVEPWKRVGVKVEGRIVADVVQTCVITAEPVPAHIDAPFLMTFLPPEAMDATPTTVAEAEIIVLYDEDDPPDPLLDHHIDLGAILVEQLALALDPYPRAPGAQWPEEGKGDDPASLSPFAALGKLRDK